MDKLADLDEERLTMLDIMIRQKEHITKVYNKKVKLKVFSIRGYVWKVILHMDQRYKALGKWSPNRKDPFKINQVFSNNFYEIEELSSKGRVLRVNGKYLKKYKSMLQEIKIST